MTVICFHNPTEEYGFLSNWYHSAFNYDMVSFTSVEQFMMYHKALCFHDENTAVRIIDEKNPAQIKKLGRLVSGYNDHIWNGLRQLIVYEGLCAKFSQNHKLRHSLLDTGTALLAECAVKDCIWGTGLSMNDNRRLDPSLWQGKNLLGYTLMMVRDRLK